MQVGIISALKSENDLLLEQMDQPITVTEKGKRCYFHGTLFGKNTVVVVSGMGKVAAAMTATQMIADYQPGFILFTGVAGGIHKDLSVGDIVVANALVQHDMDSSPLFPRYEIPLLGIQELIPDKSLSAVVKHAAQKFVEEKLCVSILQGTLEEFGIDSPLVYERMVASGDQFFSSKEDSRNLSQRLPDASCVEMEGAAVAQVCHEYNVPFSVVRTISDSANVDAMIDFEKFVSKVASTYSIGIIKELYSLLGEKVLSKVNHGRES